MEEAGIEYWKVDWGKRCNDNEYRKMLTRTAEKYAPRLIVEHCHVSAPYNTPLEPEEAKAAKAEGLSWIFHDIGEQGSLAPNYMEGYKNVMPISHVFRLYDVTFELGIPTMVERAAKALAAFGPGNPARCLLNCESNPYIGAGLGICFEILPLPSKDITYHEQVIKGGRETSENILSMLPNDWIDTLRGGPLFFDMKLLELARALNWHRIAPPFPVGEYITHLSETILSDSWDLRQQKTWYSNDLSGILVQKAPATVCRNMDPVEVKATDNNNSEINVPYVLACKYLNGAVAIATMGRISPETGYINPEADITADIKEMNAPVGLFGIFGSVTLKAANIQKGAEVWAQDLAEQTPVNITSKVNIENGILSIPGSVAKEICKPFNESDISEPGMVVVMRT